MTATTPEGPKRPSPNPAGRPRLEVGVVAERGDGYPLPAAKLEEGFLPVRFDHFDVERYLHGTTLTR